MQVSSQTPTTSKASDSSAIVPTARSAWAWLIAVLPVSTEGPSAAGVPAWGRQSLPRSARGAAIELHFARVEESRRFAHLATHASQIRLQSPSELCRARAARGREAPRRAPERHPVPDQPARRAERLAAGVRGARGARPARRRELQARLAGRRRRGGPAIRGLGARL